MRASVLVAFVLIITPASLSAQETGSGAMHTTATGSTMEIAKDTGSLLRRLDLLVAEAQAIDVKSRGDALDRETKYGQLALERSRQEPRRLEHRVACRERMRKANRDEQVRTAATCFREMLALELAVVRKERTLVASFSWIPDASRMRPLAATDELISALQTIIDAIDAGIYTEILELEDAKARLHEKYRLPRMAAMMTLEAERDRAWNALFALRIQQMLENGLDVSEAYDRLLPAIDCLELQQAGWASDGVEIPYLEIKDKIGQFQSNQARCIQLVRSVNVVGDGAGPAWATDEPESPSE